ncbi:MAG: LysE family translocator [Pseudomonadota bacterium]
MSLEWFVAVATFAVVTCFTPGPNNTMLMASGLNFGFQRTLPHMLGVSIGFSVMVLAVAFGISGVFLAFPQLYDILKVISVLYLLWLAWRIASANPKAAADDAGSRPFTFLEAAAFQWVNPKAWIMALGASTTYVLAGYGVISVVAMAVIFLAAGLGSSTTWAVGGSALRQVISNTTAVRVINVVLAALLVASLWPIAREWIV